MLLYCTRLINIIICKTNTNSPPPIQGLRSPGLLTSAVLGRAPDGWRGAAGICAPADSKNTAALHEFVPLPSLMDVKLLLEDPFQTDNQQGTTGMKFRKSCRMVKVRFP